MWTLRIALWALLLDMSHTDCTEGTEVEHNSALLLEVFKATGTTDTTVGCNLLFYFIDLKYPTTLQEYKLVKKNS